MFDLSGGIGFGADIVTSNTKPFAKSDAFKVLYAGFAGVGDTGIVKDATQRLGFSFLRGGSVVLVVLIILIVLKIMRRL